MLLGPKCNHDLGILLRLVDVAATPTDIERVKSAVLDAIGDHEFYCASYSSKEQPHMEGLLTTLIDGMKAKEAEQCVLGSNLKLLFSCMILGHSYSFSALFCVCFWACGAFVIAHLQVFKGCVDGDRLHFQHAFRVLLVVCVFLVCM